jgi:F-type H+-transporting ATPase subunit gamma
MAKKFIYFKKQISGISDIRETVKALEKIAAANVHNLKTTSQRMIDYESGLKKIFCDMPEKDTDHPLFRKHEKSKGLKILLSTETGLCGGLLNRLLDFFRPGLKGNEEVLVLGKRGKKLCQQQKIKINYFFPAPEDIPQEEEIRKIKDFVIAGFVRGEYDQVLIFYPKFESLAVQRPSLFDFLPFDEEKFRQDIGRGATKEVMGYPLYEPSSQQILDYLIKEYLGLVFYQKVLETKLSELSARTVAMEEAAGKAQKLINLLSHQYFRIRRETITRNISDLYAHRALQSTYAQNSGKNY